MTEYPVSPAVAQYPCKCGHRFDEHVVSPDLKDVEPCRICEDCRDFWADFS